MHRGQKPPVAAGRAYRLTQNRGTGSPTGLSSARQILDERYARGEIDDQEYRRRRAELQ
ncbi:MAG: SHOCT domain-containing protein [Pseudonocardiales bacterium]